MLSPKEKAVVQRLGMSPCACFDCAMKLTRANESSGLDFVSSELIAVPLCQHCADARDYRSGAA